MTLICCTAVSSIDEKHCCNLFAEMLRTVALTLMHHLKIKHSQLWPHGDKRSQRRAKHRSPRPRKLPGSVVMTWRWGLTAYGALTAVGGVQEYVEFTFSTLTMTYFQLEGRLSGTNAFNLILICSQFHFQTCHKSWCFSSYSLVLFCKRRYLSTKCFLKNFLLKFLLKVVKQFHFHLFCHRLKVFVSSW